MIPVFTVFSKPNGLRYPQVGGRR